MSRLRAAFLYSESVMDIYPASRVFCPMNRNEQDGNVCVFCEHYDGHKMNASDASALPNVPPAFIIECGYPD